MMELFFGLAGIHGLLLHGKKSQDQDQDLGLGHCQDQGEGPHPEAVAG